MNLFLFRVPAVLLCILFGTIGCTSIYKATMDERRIGTQANDEKIESTILGKFVADENIKALDLTAKCFRGHVYLVGEYESPIQMDRALEIVKEVEGVKSFTPYLIPRKNIASCGTSDNIRIRGEIETKLIGDREIRSTNVHVRVLQCRAVLVGIVGAPKEIQRSIAHAKSVKGVLEVKSYLQASK